MGAILRKYGESATFNFSLFEIDGIDFRVDAVHASGDTVVMKDEGAEASTTNGFTDEGTGYSLVLTATEMEAARVVIYIVDQTGTKAWLDKSIVIETYGNASAQHAFDLDTASNNFDPANDDVAVVTLVNTTTTNTDMITVAETAGAVWDALTASYVDADSFGKKIGDIGTASDLVDAIYEEPIINQVTSGSFGEEIKLHSKATALSTHDGKLDTVDANVDAILLDTAEIANLNDFNPASDDVAVVTLVNTVTDVTNQVTASANADAVWDDVASSHVTGGSFGSEVQTHATSTELATHDSKLDVVDANVDLILEDTGTTIPAQISALNNISTVEVGAEVDASLASYDSPTKSEMDAGFASLNDPTATENATALLATTLTEPATGLADKTVSGFLFHLFSRFYHIVTQTSTQQKVYKDDGTTVLGTMATSDDGTTQTKGKAN